jgi:hypothetical protein
MATLLGSVALAFVRKDTTMPTNKDFKHLVRSRMKKTGEAYTTARSHLLRKPATGSAPVPNYAALAGMSDAAVAKRTGFTWAQWVDVLERAGARDWTHRATAEYVQKTHGVADWWAQTVTVGYERIRGLRQIGQRMSGAFEATKSKTVNAPAAAAFKAFNDAKARRGWLTGVKTVRKATPNKSVRLTMEDGTSVEVWIIAKGATKSSVQLSHRKLSSRADADARKLYWTERLDVLAKQLKR